MNDALRIDRAATVRRVELDATSWVDCIDGFVVDPQHEFDTLRDATRWKTTEVLRYDRYVPERRLSAGLRAADVTLLRQIGMHLDARYRVALTGVAAILYRDGEDFQGLHSDREMRWLDDTLVAITVLGVRRPFVVRPRGRWADAVERVPAGADPNDIVFTPGEGDVLIMGGRCQRDWMHGVPAFATDQPRMSLTWRWTSRTGRPDTNPTFYDGQHFADGPRQPSTRRRPG